MGKLEIPKPDHAANFTPSQVHSAGDSDTLYVIADYLIGSNTFHGVSKIQNIDKSIIRKMSATIHESKDISKYHIIFVLHLYLLYL